MRDDALHDLAWAAGLLPRWHDYRGAEQEVAPDTLRAVLTALDLPCATPAQIAECRQALRQEPERPRTPPTARAPDVEELAGHPRPWGLSVQLYSLRRAGDGGLGDFTALADCARAAARHGADALAISPVHAPFLADPAKHSPYMPSSRLFLNPWHIDPGTPLASPVEAASLIDWPAATAERLTRLRALYADMRPSLDSGPDAGAFQAFRARGGAALRDHAHFEALCAARGGDWRQWPASLHDPNGPAVAQFAREHAHEVTFHVFLQWLADRGLAAAQKAARDAGMGIGLVSDLAVGIDPGGSEAWSRPDTMLRGLTLGAPPDELNTLGQNWGLTTFSPRALARNEGAPLLEVLRAALHHAGGVRIDHVLGLNRIWVIPEGAGATQGVYLQCPLALLLDTVAREAHRKRALAVGEDLGTVPTGLRPRLEAAGLMGLRVLLFMREHGLFMEPSRWPAGAVATTATHDTPTVAGWWLGRDLGWRTRSGQLGIHDAKAAHEARTRDRRALWDAFLHAGVASGEMPAEPPRVVDAAVRFVARAPAKLALVPIEDIAGLNEQPNLPGTTTEHPNWRRRLPAPVETLLEEPSAVARLTALREERTPASNVIPA